MICSHTGRCIHIEYAIVVASGIGVNDQIILLCCIDILF